MKKFVLLGILALSFGSIAAKADDHPCPGPDCRPPTKDVCFNLMCIYNSEDHIADHDDKSCTVASTFVKEVTLDGGEVIDDSDRDDSDRDNVTTLEVSCGGKVLFDNSAYRHTDLLGTRIQGQEGPTPAITLPRGELHTVESGQGGGHYSWSTLEFQTEERFKHLDGSCFIWAGKP
ncbi:MAG: hypothetical protein P4M08_07410 [Oligoflexia bacterium]|nr:hypothetical protein [Oligoflexia bacterium]